MRKAFICPTKYVQGPDEILNLGYFVKSFGDSALLIARPDDVARVKDKLDATCEKFGVVFVESNFGGECSRQEVARLQELAKAKGCSCTIGLGGGKAIDTTKCVAQGEALIIVPTIAATDAPTSHSAVLYTPDGAFDDYAYFKQSPSVVLIDTTVVASALKGAIFAANLYERLGFAVVPNGQEPRHDIIQAVEFGTPEGVIAFCKGIQAASPVDSHVTPEPWAMPGYDSDVIMAAGAFVQGSSIELSADGPIKPPYAVYFQGGLTWPHAKLGILKSLQQLADEGVVSL